MEEDGGRVPLYSSGFRYKTAFNGNLKRLLML
jgi:hypothetical protein